MKKFLKFLFGTFSVIAAVCGILILYKNLIQKDETNDDDSDEFEDDFDEFETEKEGNASESREYVPINIGGNTQESEDHSTTEENETEDDSTSQSEVSNEEVSEESNVSSLSEE